MKTDREYEDLNLKYSALILEASVLRNHELKMMEKYEAVIREKDKIIRGLKNPNWETQHARIHSSRNSRN